MRNGKDLNNFFWEFLVEVGMFVDQKNIEGYTDEDTKSEKLRYMNAISAGVQG